MFFDVEYADETETVSQNGRPHFEFFGVGADLVREVIDVVRDHFFVEPNAARNLTGESNVLPQSSGPHDVRFPQ